MTLSCCATLKDSGVIHDHTPVSDSGAKFPQAPAACFLGLGLCNPVPGPTRSGRKSKHPAGSEESSHFLSACLVRRIILGLALTSALRSPQASGWVKTFLFVPLLISLGPHSILHTLCLACFSLSSVDIPKASRLNGHFVYSQTRLLH